MAKVNENKSGGNFYSGNDVIAAYIGYDVQGNPRKEMSEHRTSYEREENGEKISGEVAFFWNKQEKRVIYVYTRSDSDGLFADDRPLYGQADVRGAEDDKEILEMQQNATIDRIVRRLNGEKVNEHNTVEG